MLKELFDKGFIDQTAYTQLTDLFGSEYETLVAEFMQKLPTTIMQLRNAVAAVDFFQIGELAHSMKGVAGNLGFLEFASKCLALETSARENKISNFQPLFNDLENYADKMR